MAGGRREPFLDAAQARPRRALPGAAARTAEAARAARPEGLDVTIVEKPADSTAISLGFPIDVTRRDDDFYALAVANSYLGEHRTFNGKLMQDLRGKRGLNYGDYSYIEDFIQEGHAPSPSRTTRDASSTSRSGSAPSRTTRRSSPSGRPSGSSTA